MTDFPTLFSPDQNQPPNSWEAEQAVLGSILINAECYDEISSVLSPDDFFLVKHKWIYQAIVEMKKRNQSLDNVTVTQALADRKQLEDIGGPGYITELINNTPTHIHAYVYAKIVESAAVRRGLLDAAGDIAKAALELDARVEDVCREADQILFQASHRGYVNRSVKLGDLAYRRWEEINNAEEGESIGVTTGLQSINRRLTTGGLAPGKAILIAARSGIGKSSLAIKIALSAAMSGKHVRFHSLEMEEDEIGDSLIAMFTTIQTQKLAEMTLNDAEKSALLANIPDLDRLNITIDTTPQININQIAALSRKQIALDGLDLLIIDYAGLLEPVEHLKGENHRRLELAQLSRAIKLLARELHIPIVVLNQLNREASSGEPQLHHLAESGSWEQDADIVIFLWEDPTNPAQRLCKIAKQRRGPRSEPFVLRWNGTLTTLTDPGTVPVPGKIA